MYNVLNQGKTGLKSMQYKMDAVADSIANLNTEGYKKKNISFQELVNNEEINAGSRSFIGKISYDQGSLIESPYDYHMAISGDGFFGVIDENNTLMLTRNGNFHMNEDKSISDDNGYPLVIEYEVPVEEWDGESVIINGDGDIKSAMDDSIVLGRVVLFKPENLESLTSLGEGRYLPSAEVNLLDSINQSDEFGQINQHYLEASNVDIIEALADMISTQRAYSLNAKAIQTTDDLMTIINGIKR